MGGGNEEGRGEVFKGWKVQGGREKANERKIYEEMKEGKVQLCDATFDLDIKFTYINMRSHWII